MVMVFDSRLAALAPWRHDVASRMQAVMRAKFKLLAAIARPSPLVYDTYACINPQFLVDDTNCTVRSAYACATLQLLSVLLSAYTSMYHVSVREEHTQAEYPRNQLLGQSVACSALLSG